MFAIAALVLFILDPFVEHVGPWPAVTLGLAFVAAHLIHPWEPWG